MVREVSYEVKTKEIVRCDFCDKEAGHKCEACDKDLCDDHYVEALFRNETIIIYAITVCVPCSKELFGPACLYIHTRYQKKEEL